MHPDTPDRCHALAINIEVRAANIALIAWLFAAAAIVALLVAANSTHDGDSFWLWFIGGLLAAFLAAFTAALAQILKVRAHLLRIQAALQQSRRQDI